MESKLIYMEHTMALIGVVNIKQHNQLIKSSVIKQTESVKYLVIS